MAGLFEIKTLTMLPRKPYLFRNLRTRKKYIRLHRQQVRFTKYVGLKFVDKGVTTNK